MPYLSHMTVNTNSNLITTINSKPYSVFPTQMAKQKQNNLIKLKQTLLSLLIDKLSLLRRATSPIHLTVLLATPRFPSSPPPSHRLSAILSLSTISPLKHRLRKTSSAHVALKCLITFHIIITRGSFILRDQLPCNFVNLSSFRDSSNFQTWELSNWVRFYSHYLETNISVCRKIGFFTYGSKNKVGSANLSNWELFRDIEILVGLMEEICRAPSSGFDHKSSLVHEILRLISEDYGSILRLVESRLNEFKGRVNELNRTELGELASLLRRVEECRERVSEIFGNKKRNDAFWEFVNGTVSELILLREQVGETGQVLRLTYGSEWVGLNQGRFTVSQSRVVA